MANRLSYFAVNGSGLRSASFFFDEFRAQASSFNSIEGGHLICEVRQWTLQGKSRAAAWAWMLTLSSDHLEDGSKAEWEELLAELLRLSCR